MDSQRLIVFFVYSFSVFLLLDAWQRDQQPQQPAATAQGTGNAAKPVPASVQLPAPTKN